MVHSRLHALVGAVIATAFLAAAPAHTAIAAAPRVGVAVATPATAPALDCEDYYAPPWGYPPDHCRYEIWDQPVYAGGVWYNGPIYWRLDNGVRVFWINGGWRPHGWNAPPPRFIWGRKGFVVWHGPSHFGKHHWRFGSRRNWRGSPAIRTAASPVVRVGPRRGHGGPHRRGHGRRGHGHGHR